jgi:hypothetical protein
VESGRRRIEGVIWFLGGTLATACAGCHTASHTTPERGPLPLRTNGPLVQTFLVMRPRSAETVAPGAAELRVLSVYSSIFEVGSGTQGSVSFDGELWRTSALFRTGLSSRTDLEVEVPFVYASSGFLDVFIETWHALLGFPDGGRETRPHFDYDMRLRADGQEAWSMTGDRLGLGDVPVVVTQRIVDAHGSSPAVFLRGAVELPVGSEEDGFGNGAIDWGLGVGLECDVADWTFGAGAGWTDRASPDSMARVGLDVEDGLAANVSGEWRWSVSSSLLLGLRYENAVSDDLGIEELGGDVIELDVGVVFDAGESSRWTLAFSEDLVSESGPDFTAMLGFETRW